MGNAASLAARSRWGLLVAWMWGVIASLASAQTLDFGAGWPDSQPASQLSPEIYRLPSPEEAPAWFAIDEDVDSPGDSFQILPRGLIFRSYLAGAKESRFQSFWSQDSRDGALWDIVLGGRVGILRYGSSGCQRPTGIQLDIEGAGQPRLLPGHNADVAAADFRFGIPLTIGNERYQTKFAFYHLSSHVGDEYLLAHPTFQRLNYSRNVLVWGHSYYFTPNLRIYGEVGWATDTDVAEPWECQFGADYSPGDATGIRGAPFAAINGHLREEVDYGGNVVVQAGWAWRACPASGLFRIGVEYYNGKSDQFSFYNFSENKFGAAIWYDY